MPWPDPLRRWLLSLPPVRDALQAEEVRHHETLKKLAHTERILRQCQRRSRQNAPSSLDQ